MFEIHSYLDRLEHYKRQYMTNLIENYHVHVSVLETK